jgi:hypothetical protein
VEATAKNICDHVLAREGGPRFGRVKELDSVTSIEQTLRKNYRWSLGLFSSPSADPEGGYSANKKIHERDIVGREEFVACRPSV